MRTPGRPSPAGAVAVAAALALAGCTAEDEPGATVLPGAGVESSSPDAGAPSPATSATASPSTASVPTATTPAPVPSATGAPTGVAVGEVVEGFPLDVVPLPPGAEVTLSNAVAAEGGGRTVALAGRTALAVEEVVAFSTRALVEQGFTATTPPGVEGAVVTTFARGGAAELLTLSVTSADGQQDFSIGGRLA